MVLARALLVAFLRFGATALDCSGTQTVWDAVEGRDLSGQTHVLTGGDGGMGYETLLALASKNASVVLACRSPSTCRAAAENITRLTSNPRVSVIPVDLSSFASVREAAATMNRQLLRIDSLICNAGMGVNSDSMPSLTEDGFDRLFQVDYLSHHLLIELLLPVLRRSRGRVVIVSSNGHTLPCTYQGVGHYDPHCTELAKLADEARHTPMGWSARFVPASNYGLAKYLAVFHAAEIARREPLVMTFALHPGVVSTPLTDKVPLPISWEFCTIGGGLQRPCPRSEAQGATTQTYLAAAPALELADANGLYFDSCQPHSSMHTKYIEQHGEFATIEYQSALYELSLNLTRHSAQIVV